MSDYLTNVIARSFGVEPRIRPRLVSLFEPSRVDLPVFENEIEAERPAPLETARVERGDAPDELADSSLPPPPLKQRRRARVLPEPIEPSSNESTRVDNVNQTVDSPAAIEAPRRPVQSSAALPIDVDQAERPRQTRVVAEKVEAVSERRTVVSRNPVPSTPALSTPTEQAAPATPSLIRTNLEDRSAPPPNQTGPKTDSPKPVITRVEREIETRNVVTHVSPTPPTPPPVVVHPISVAPAPQTYKDDNAEPATPSEPTIHVTIGRVEVRNVVADEGKKSKPSRQSRLMSLDDYLRQRAQGAKS